MKISELIVYLENIKKSQGDIDVRISEYCEGDEIVECELTDYNIKLNNYNNDKYLELRY